MWLSEKMLILFCCLLPEDKAPVWLTSSSLTYLQHWSQSLIHLIILLLPSTRQLFKGPPNPFTIGARTSRHHASPTKGEHENLLELLPRTLLFRGPEPSNTMIQRLKTAKTIKTSAVKRKEEVKTLPCSLQVWSTHLSVSMMSDQQTGSQTHRQNVWRNSVCRKTWVKLPTGRGDDCSERISCVSWPSAASTVTQHLLLHLLPPFFPFPSFLTFTSLPHIRHVWSADEAAWITSEQKPLKLNCSDHLTAHRLKVGVLAIMDKLGRILGNWFNRSAQSNETGGRSILLHNFYHLLPAEKAACWVQNRLTCVGHLTLRTYTAL